MIVWYHDFFSFDLENDKDTFIKHGQTNIYIFKPASNIHTSTEPIVWHGILFCWPVSHAHLHIFLKHIKAFLKVRYICVYDGEILSLESQEQHIQQTSVSLFYSPNSSIQMFQWKLKFTCCNHWINNTEIVIGSKQAGREDNTVKWYVVFAKKVIHLNLWIQNWVVRWYMHCLALIPLHQSHVISTKRRCNWNCKGNVPHTKKIKEKGNHSVTNSNREHENKLNNKILCNNRISSCTWTDFGEGVGLWDTGWLFFMTLYGSSIKSFSN